MCREMRQPTDHITIRTNLINGSDGVIDLYRGWAVPAPSIVLSDDERSRSLYDGSKVPT